MATAAHARDVLALTRTLYDTGRFRDAVARSDDGEPLASLSLDIYIDASDLRSALAVQQGLQLSVDAAALLLSEDEPRIDLDVDQVLAFLSDRTVELTLVWTQAGSWRARFTIDPRTAPGRRRLLAIGGITAAGLGLLFPPVAPFVTGAGILMGLADVIRPDELPPLPALETVDPSDLAGTEARIVLEGRAQAETNTEAQAPQNPPRYVVDVDIHGSAGANRAFVELLHEIPGVGKDSRTILGEEYQRIRVWSDAPIDSDRLEHIARDSGVEILGRPNRSKFG